MFSGVVNGWPYLDHNDNTWKLNTHTIICVNARDEIVICDTQQPVAYNDVILKLSHFHHWRYVYDIMMCLI